jgi:hypothetical protein
MMLSHMHSHKFIILWNTNTQTKGDATTITIVQESTIFTINAQLSTIIVTIKKTVTIIVDKCT